MRTSIQYCYFAVWCLSTCTYAYGYAFVLIRIRTVFVQLTSYYNLEKLEPEDVTGYLYRIIDNALEDLEASHCIELDEAHLFCLLSKSSNC